MRLLNTLSFSIIMLLLIACSSDNKNDKPIEPTISEITLDKDEATLVIDGEPAIIKILEGNGSYSAFAINSKLVNVTIDKNELILNGLMIGSTNILLSDADMLLKKIPVKVVKTEFIEVGDGSDKYSFTTIQGNSENFTLPITDGNDGYKVITDNSELIKVTIVQNNTIQITTVEGNLGGQANITITDAAGLEKTIGVEMISSSNPFTEEYIATVISKEVSKSELMFWNTLVNDYSFKNEESNGRNSMEISKSVGNWWNSYVSNVIFDYPLDLASSTNDATISFSNYPSQGMNSNTPQELEEFQVVKDDNTSTRVIFKYTDEKNVLRYGYFIYLK